MSEFDGVCLFFYAAGGTIHCFHLFHAWIWFAVCVANPVGTEVPVIFDARQFAQITTKGFPCNAPCIRDWLFGVLQTVISHRKPLVFPVPDETALQTWVFPYRVPIVAKPSEAVTHRVAVLHHDIWPPACVVARIPRKVVYARIHNSHNISVPIQLGTLVAHRPRLIQIFQSSVRLLKTNPVPTLVSQ